MKHHRVFGRHQRQRGAAAVFVAIALVALVLATMLSIDIGRTYLAHRNLQKLANLAALDGARLISGCGTSGLPTQTGLNTAIQNSLTRNGYNGTQTSFVAEAGRITTAKQEKTGTAQIRYLVPVNLTDTAAMQTAFGARVTLSRPFPTPLLPLFSSPNNSAMRVSATAEQTALGNFYLGSGLLSLNAGVLNALLSGLLGGNVNLSVLDYQALAGASVSLANLGTAVGLNVQDLSNPLALSTKTPIASDLLNGLAGALSGTASTTVTGLLTNLANAASGNRNTIPLGNLLGTVDDVAAQVPFVNLMDLILALGQSAAANASGGPTPIALPIGLAIPGVTTLKTFVTIIEPPQLSGLRRAGSAVASTAQVRILARLQVDALSNITSALNLVLLGGLLGSIEAPPINLGIDIDVARADAVLDSLQCPTTAVPHPVARLSAEPALAKLTLGTFTGSATSAPAITQGLSKLLGVTIKILGGLLAEIKVNLFLASPVSSTVGSGVMTPLPNPVDQFTKITPTISGAKPYWLAKGVPPAAAIAGENPQTIGSTNLLQGTVSSLFSNLNITASDPDHPDQS
ncbi:MAG: pilus assembly protein TadG-related protein, partial [Solimonas sp.]